MIDSTKSRREVTSENEEKVKGLKKIWHHCEFLKKRFEERKTD